MFSNWDTEARSKCKHTNKTNWSSHQQVVHMKYVDKRRACARSCPHSARNLSQHSMPGRVQPEDTDTGSRERANSRPPSANSSYSYHNIRNTHCDLSFVFWGAGFSKYLHFFLTHCFRRTAVADWWPLGIQHTARSKCEFMLYKLWLSWISQQRFIYVG